MSGRPQGFVTARHFTHFIAHSKFPQGAAFVHAEGAVTYTHVHAHTPSPPLRVSPGRVPSSAGGGDAKANCRSGEATTGLCGSRRVRVWGDVTFLGWHEAALCPLAPGGSSQGKTLMEVWGLQGGHFMVWTKSLALQQKRPVWHKLETSSLAASCFYELCGSRACSFAVFFIKTYKEKMKLYIQERLYDFNFAWKNIHYKPKEVNLYFIFIFLI